MDVVLLRYGEIGTKSWRKRPFFEKLYVDAIKFALDKNGIDDYKIENLGGRFIVRHEKADKILHILRKVPGIQSLSSAKYLSFDSKDDLIKKAYDICAPSVKDKTFKLSVKRTGKHDFGSQDIAIELGKYLEDNSKGVVMKGSDIVINIEIRHKETYIFTDSVDGIGGLPPRSAGKVLCLFSGGIDSPVASYKVLGRGFQTDFLYVNMLGEKGVYQTAQVYNYITSQFCYGFTPRFFVVDALEIVAKIKKEVRSQNRQIAIKIALYKLAESIARRNDLSAIITGESLSQKSSQTVESLSVIDSQIDMLVLRPLSCMDKVEIVKVAREIGTMAYSEKVKEFCNLAEGPVTTTPSMAILSYIPSFEEEVKKALESMKQYKGLCDCKLEEEPDLEGFEDSIIVDITSGFVKKKIKSDMKKDYPEVLDEICTFDKKKDYIIVCDFGVKAENMAASMRKKGIRAVGMSIEAFEKFKDEDK